MQLQMSAVMANIYLKRNGEDTGMQNNLKMNKYRIVEVADPILETDVANRRFTRYAIANNADLQTTQLLPRMTSNSTPSPYQISASNSSPDAWKCASADSAYTISDHTETITVNIASLQPCDSVSLELSDKVSRIEILANNTNLIDLNDVGGKQILYFQYRTYMQFLDIRISTPIGSNIQLSNVFLKSETLLAGKPTSVHLPTKHNHALNNVALMHSAGSRLSIVQPQYLIPPMTGDFTPSPYSFSSPNGAQEGFAVYKCADYKLETNYISLGDSDEVIIDVDSGGLLVFGAFDICGCTQFSNSGVTFQLEGSANDVDWNDMIGGSFDLPDIVTVFECIQPNSIRFLRMTLRKPHDQTTPIGLNTFLMRSIRSTIMGTLTTDYIPQAPADVVNKAYSDFLRRAILSTTSATPVPHTIPLHSQPIATTLTSLIIAPDFDITSGGRDIELSDGSLLLRTTFGQHRNWIMNLSMTLSCSNSTPFIFYVTLFDVLSFPSPQPPQYVQFRQCVKQRCVSRATVSCSELLSNVSDRTLALRLTCDSANVTLDFMRLTCVLV